MINVECDIDHIPTRGTAIVPVFNKVRAEFKLIIGGSLTQRTTVHIIHRYDFYYEYSIIARKVVQDWM